MSKFSKAMRTTNTVASLLIAIGVAVDLYEKFKGGKNTLVVWLIQGQENTYSQMLEILNQEGFVTSRGFRLPTIGMRC